MNTVVFLSPELLQLLEWKKVMSSKVFSEKLAIVAIDEAHCIAEWLVEVVRLLRQQCYYNM